MCEIAQDNKMFSSMSRYLRATIKAEEKEVLNATITPLTPGLGIVHKPLVHQTTSVIVLHHMIIVPKRPKFLFHRFPSPALAREASSSLTLNPYCLMQQVKALLLCPGAVCSGGVLSPSTIPALGSRSFNAVADWDGLVVGFFPGLSFSCSSSLSRGGWSPGL